MAGLLFPGAGSHSAQSIGSADQQVVRVGSRQDFADRASVLLLRLQDLQCCWLQRQQAAVTAACQQQAAI